MAAPPPSDACASDTSTLNYHPHQQKSNEFRNNAKGCENVTDQFVYSDTNNQTADNESKVRNKDDVKHVTFNGKNYDLISDAGRLCDAVQDPSHSYICVSGHLDTERDDDSESPRIVNSTEKLTDPSVTIRHVSDSDLNSDGLQFNIHHAYPVHVTPSGFLETSFNGDIDAVKNDFHKSLDSVSISDTESNEEDYFQGEEEQPEDSSSSSNDCEEYEDVTDLGEEDSSENLSEQKGKHFSYFFKPISSLFKFSFRRYYNISRQELKMGNLQGSEGKNKDKTGKSPGKGKKSKESKKSPAKDLIKQQLKGPAPKPPSSAPVKTITKAEEEEVEQIVVTPAAIVNEHVLGHGSVDSHNGPQCEVGINSEAATSLPTTEPSVSTSITSGEDQTKYLVTDSWRHVKKLAINSPAHTSATTESPNRGLSVLTDLNLLTPPSRESSSESVFTDPLTPQGFADAHGNDSLTSYYSDSGGKHAPVPVKVVGPARNLGYFNSHVNGLDDNSSASIVAEELDWDSSDVRMVGFLSDERQKDDEHDAVKSLSIASEDVTQISDASADDVTLTLVEDAGDSEALTLSQKRPQSYSLDALDEEEHIGDDDMGKSLSDDTLDTDRRREHMSQKTPPSAFTVVRHRKVELTPTRLSENIITGGAAPDAQKDYRRHSSVSDVPLDSNVLRKVASLTLDKATLEQKVSRARYVPERLDFQAYEKFEGQMLMNWFVSSFGEDHYLRVLLTTQDLRILAAQFCTHLLAAGVLRQIPDKDVPLETLFRPDLMYYWSHTEIPAAAPHTPGRLSQLSWPPTSPGLPDVTNIISNRHGARYSEAEFQTVVMGLKREHQENLNRLVQRNEVQLFGIRGESAEKLHEAEEKIKTLEQELDRYRTLADIQSLTAKAEEDFGSPKIERKSLPTEEIRSEQHVAVAVKTCDKCTDTSDLTVENKSSPPVKCVSVCTSPLSSPVTQKSKADIEDSFRTISNKISPEQPPVSETRTTSVKQDTSSDSKVTDHKQSEHTETKSEINVENKVPSVSVTETLPPTSAGPPPPPPITGMGPPPPSMSGMPGMEPPPPPMPGMVPPPPPMTGMGPPPPPMTGMGPPPPPMPGMGPPPPSMPGMGPPPPPMPGMGPPPPPMPGMGPPPPPMPGMGPPPPPMPGMGPPPPPMPGMGPLPPPMPGMGPPPPPPPVSGAVGAPPPPPGPLPFPAPPVGGWAASRAMLRKKPVNPEVPMKPLYWTRIIVPTPEQPPSESGDTVDSSTKTDKNLLWEKLEEAKIEDMKQFEELFSRQVIERKPTKKREEKPTKQQAVKILDSKRSQNVGILASSLHVEFSEIENAIYNFDTSAVSLEALHQIYEVRATEEELAAIRNHISTKPDVPLDKPEQFLYELAEIPNFAFRISCFMFQSEFDDGISSIESKLANLKSTCMFLLTSKSLESVFAIILALGNYMNGGNMTRGQADGFGLEILAKLKDVKSKDSSVTLLHFIVRTYMKKIEDPLNPNVTLPVPEPGDIDRAANVNFDDLSKDLQKLQNDLQICEKKTEKVIAASTEETLQPFKQKMELFIKRAKEQLNGETENLEECKQRFKETMSFYHYTPKGGVKLEEVDTKDFFALWSPFCSDFKDIWKKEQQRLIKEKAQEIKRIQGQKRNIKTSKLEETGLKAKLQKRHFKK